MRLAKILFVIAAGSVAALAQSSEATDMKTYMERSVSLGAVAGAGLGAAVNQGTNTPSEWGQGAAGFAKRFGSSFGKHVVKRAIQFPVSKLFHEEFNYQRSDKEGFKPRLVYALEATVITHKTTTGKRTVSKGEIVGAFGSGLVSRVWQPASTRTIGLGFASGAITLGADAAGNVVREFWPEIRHPHSHNAGQGKSSLSQPSNAAVTEPKKNRE